MQKCRQFEFNLNVNGRPALAHVQAGYREDDFLEFQVYDNEDGELVCDEETAPDAVRDQIAWKLYHASEKTA